MTLGKVVIGIGLIGLALSLLLGGFLWQWIGSALSVAVIIVGATLEEKSYSKERRN